MTINWILGLIQCTRLISHIHWKVFIPQNHFHQTWAGVTLTSFIVTLPRHKQCYSINVMDNCSERERERETTTITKQHVEMTSFQAEWEWEGKQGKVGNVTSPPPQTIFSLSLSLSQRRLNCVSEPLMCMFRSVDAFVLMYFKFK
jgi:hypothetical protein